MVKRRTYYKLFRSFTGVYFRSLCAVPSHHDTFSSTDSPASDQPLMNLEVKWIDARSLRVVCQFSHEYFRDFADPFNSCLHCIILRMYLLGLFC